MGNFNFTLKPKILIWLVLLLLSLYLFQSQSADNNNNNNSPPNSVATAPRKIVIVRHGERVDRVFGDNWTTQAFNPQGTYTKFNLNMPDTIEQKAGMPGTYRGDSPLTQVGHLQGYLVGKGLAEQQVLRPGFVTYVSPALRSVQTAAELLKGLQEKTAGKSVHGKMKVEPALFEWTGFYNDGIPSWLTGEELSASGYNVDLGYEPFLKREQLQGIEPTETYYERSYDFMRHLLDTIEESKDILLVAHGITLDAATQQLFGKAPKSIQDMIRTLSTVKIPYAAVGILQQIEDQDGNKKWTFEAPGPITMKHEANSDFKADKQFPHHQ